MLFNHFKEGIFYPGRARDTFITLFTKRMKEKARDKKKIQDPSFSKENGLN